MSTDIDSYPFRVYSGLLRDGHRQKMGGAIWEFLWLIDKVTREENGIGIVLGGHELKIENIAGEMNTPARTVQRNLHRLADKEYINLKRGQYGVIITVNKSKKRGRPAKSGTSAKSGVSEIKGEPVDNPSRYAKSGTSKKSQICQKLRPDMPNLTPDTPKVAHHYNKEYDSTGLKDTKTWSQIEALLKSFPQKIQTLIHAYWGCAANENKSKNIADGRRLTLITELKEVFDKTNPDAFQYALQETVKHEAPNINYLKKVLKNQEKQKQVQAKIAKECEEDEVKVEKLLNQAKKDLGGIGGKEYVKEWLVKIPRKYWGRLRIFYVRRYPADHSGWDLAVQELDKEGRR